jgi:hypothetical protein
LDFRGFVPVSFQPQVGIQLWVVVRGRRAGLAGSIAGVTGCGGVAG